MRNSFVRGLFAGRVFSLVSDRAFFLAPRLLPRDISDQATTKKLITIPQGQS
jgi:hypothetical protein